MAQPVIELRSRDGMHGIMSQAAYLIDTNAVWGITEVSSPAMQSRFRPFRKQGENFGIGPEVVWVRIVCSTQEEHDWFLTENGALVSSYCLYYKEGENWKSSCRGYKYPAESNEVQISNTTFPVRVRPGDTTVLYIRGQSPLPKVIGLSMGPALSAVELAHEEGIAGGIYAGIVLIMILYNLFLFISNRQAGYVYYALYMFFNGVFVLFNIGMARYLPRFMQEIHENTAAVYPVLFGLFGLLFTENFLNLRKHFPRMAKLLPYFYIMAGIAILLSYFSPYNGSKFIQLLGTLLSIYSIVVGWFSWRSGYSPAKYYVLGFGSYMLSLGIYIGVGVSGSDFFGLDPKYVLLIGSSLEGIILSFALGDKLNMAQKGEQEAREKAYASAIENERLVREQNIVLERKVQERTAEISEQKAIIEEKNKDILDSIHYARRIQRALLASETMLKKNLPQHFVFYKPKDIVSGDFYWADEMPDGKFLLLAGDCTGHGVPGAFMSLLNISILHELTNGMKLSRPDELLNTQRDAIIMSLNPEGSDEVSKDGMDCVLCSFDFRNRRIDFSCANNPLWIVRKGELFDFRPDKSPIGMHEGEKVLFRLQSAELQPGDMVFLFTDGYADQFGGPKGKKFKYRQLQELLLKNALLAPEQQQALLEKTFEEWRGSLEQVDDVLIIGIRV